jgi:hypothetical protein
MDLQRPLSVWRVYEMMAATLRRAIGGTLSLAQWARNRDRMERAFRDTPRKEPRNQAARARCLYLKGASP